MAATPVSSAAGLLRPDLDGVTLEFSLQENMNKFIGLQVMPETPIVMPAAQWRRVKVESLLKKPDHAIRAPRSGFQRDDFEFDIDTVFTREYGVEEYIDEVERMQYSDFFDAEAMATMRAKHRLMMLHEMRVAALSFDEAGFTAAGQFTDVGAGGANRPWNNVATATPRVTSGRASSRSKASSASSRTSPSCRTKRVTTFSMTNDFADKWEASGAGDRPMDANERDVARYLEIDRSSPGPARKTPPSKVRRRSMHPSGAIPTCSWLASLDRETSMSLASAARFAGRDSAVLSQAAWRATTSRKPTTRSSAPVTTWVRR
jgi:hypothetical protein